VGCRASSSGRWLANSSSNRNGAPNDPVVRRFISTMRDLARFVNRGALHQAYFNAALFLLGIGVPGDAGNPYRGNRYAREGGFATLGGPDLLTLVSEVASLALKVVSRQEWLVYRRCRPEVVGGLIQMQRRGLNGTMRNYDLPVALPGHPQFQAQVDAALAAVSAHNATFNGGVRTFFLPMAFTAGSRAHSAYGAGHATVAGACVTVLTPSFDEDARLADLYAAHKPGRRPRPIAMGRSMGGVHWRTALAAYGWADRSLSRSCASAA
jgi:hypothetical protein